MKKNLLTMALSFALVACSSGGGSNGSSNTPTATTPPSNTASTDTSKPATQTSSKPTTPTTQPVKAKETVKGSLSGVKEELREQVKNLKMIDVNGMKIDLASENVGFIERDLGNGLKGKAYNQAYSAIGYALPKNVKTDQYGRVIDDRVSAEDTDIYGLTTKFSDIPKSGTATYKGVSFGANSQGKLTLKADFGTTKLVSGSITERKLLSNGKKLDNITLLPTELSQYVRNGEEIHFAGTAHANVEGMPVQSVYGGKFMGPNAEEVVGYVADDNNNPYEGFAGSK